jgi:nitrite reductase (NADH) large subunit
MILPIQKPTLLVLGTGMAGAKVVEEVLVRTPDRFQIRMFGAEPNGTYNRILLSHVLAGHADDRKLWINPREWYEERGVHLHSGVKAETIDRDNRVVIGGHGKIVEPYDYLVVATGSRPFMPPLENARKKGVFVFRTLDDCAAIGEYAGQCDKAIVLGGGLLGLEAAAGLLQHRLDVTVVEMAPHLMVQQLDAAAGLLLRRKLEAMGLHFKLGARATEIVGDGEVEGVRFADGSVLDADLVVISCGIQPNVDEAKKAGLAVERAIVVDDQLRSSDPDIFAVGECAQHRGRVYGLVDPIYDQARVLADYLTEANPEAKYAGSKLATTLKVMGIDLTSMGDISGQEPGCEIVSRLDSTRGVYKKFVLKDNQLIGAIVLGEADPLGRFTRLFKDNLTCDEPALDFLQDPGAGGPAIGGGVETLPDSAKICNCNSVLKGTIVEAIKAGKCTVGAVGECTRAGTGCGSCQGTIQSLIDFCLPASTTKSAKNKIEIMKEQQDGLDYFPDLLQLASRDAWRDMTEDDKQRSKWEGLFYRKPTPGNFMLRIRLNAGRLDSRQFRVLADLSDEFGKGFADLTTRQQIQLRWFTLGQTPEIWRRLEEVGLTSKQTGMDNVRGICGCPLAGKTPHELLDATNVIERYNDLITGTKEFSNLPRKFNVTITGCMENCTHGETQDISLVPALRDLDGQTVSGFNVHVGGKQGSGGYRPATPLDDFVRPEDAPELCADITRIFRDHGPRATRNRARLAFLIEDRGVGWFRSELARRWGQKLHKAGKDARKDKHVDHLGIHPPHKDIPNNRELYYVGFAVPVGRITTAQMRAVADLADSYGGGEIRITVGQNLVVTNIPREKIAALMDEPLFKELPYDPSPIMRGLVCCTGTDYCGMALIDTKGYALEVARELEKRTAGRKTLPLSMHWSGCPASCGLHQVATIGMQGCRSRINGEIVDATHVTVNGKTGPHAAIASDLMYDIPITELAAALEPLVLYLPR